MKRKRNFLIFIILIFLFTDLLSISYAKGKDDRDIIIKDFFSKKILFNRESKESDVVDINDNKIKRIILNDNAFIDYDANNNVIAFDTNNLYNQQANSISFCNKILIKNNLSDSQYIINGENDIELVELANKFNISNEYQIVLSEEDNLEWILKYSRINRDGVENPYDSFCFSINRYTGEINSFRRFSEKIKEFSVKDNEEIEYILLTDEEKSKYIIDIVNNYCEGNNYDDSYIRPLVIKNIDGLEYCIDKDNGYVYGLVNRNRIAKTISGNSNSGWAN